jgi:hypothetical protein
MARSYAWIYFLLWLGRIKAKALLVPVRCVTMYTGWCLSRKLNKKLKALNDKAQKAKEAYGTGKNDKA